MVKSSLANKSQKSPAFTIVELLVVIVVIAILAAITVVSYTGMTSRASVASLQSDLANASTILKLYQVANNDNFPVTLAEVNNGKGIAPSQNMDDIVYVPDNISKPKNFCLEYRKGINFYAVDSTSQPTKGVCLVNLINNGDFSNGVNNWLGSNSTLSVLNNTLTITVIKLDSTWYNIGLYNNVINGINATHKYYISESVNSDTAGDFSLRWGFGGHTTDVSGLNKGTFTRLSQITNAPDSSQNFRSYTKYGSTIAVNEHIYIRDILLLDLTASFGAGNEPTKAQMDTMMANYSNSWFNIVTKANF